jgi:hypothetical protein
MNENTKNLSSIIEDISISKSVSNFWDDILSGNESFNGGCSNRFLNIFDNNAYTVRFLGPILKAKRLFVDAKTHLMEFITPNELKEIIEENRTVFEKVTNRIDSSKPFVNAVSNIDNPNRFREIKNRSGVVFKQVQATPIEILHSLFCKDSPVQVKLWQDCFLTNVYIKNITVSGRNDIVSDRIKILPIPKTTWSQLAMAIRNIKGSGNKKMGGIYAYDLTFSKQSVASKNQFATTTVALSDTQLFLTRQEISYVLNNGLIDIKKAIKEYNRLNALKMAKGKALMFYDFEDYKLPEELMHGIYSEIEDFEFQEQMDCVEENLHNLPPEAIGDYQSLGSVGSLEL